MNALIDKDSGFPWVEETKFTGWLVQFKAHLRKTSSHVVLDIPRPSDMTDDGDPTERRAFVATQREYYQLDIIAFLGLIKGSRINP